MVCFSPPLTENVANAAATWDADRTLGTVAMRTLRALIILAENTLMIQLNPCYTQLVPIMDYVTTQKANVDAL